MRGENSIIRLLRLFYPRQKILISWFTFRNHPYDTMDEYFRDGMRLAKGMSHKNALAGLAWGGGKGVMARNSGTGLNYNDPPAARHLAYKEYGSFLTNLRGCYVTAEDVGTSVLDMTAIYSATRYTTCIPWELGGSGNPSIPTAHGVAAGMEAAFAFLGRSLRGISVAVMGVGHVGEPLCKILFEKVANLIFNHQHESLTNHF